MYEENYVQKRTSPQITAPGCGASGMGSQAMEKGSIRIDLIKMIRFFCKRIWILIICAAVGFAGYYLYTVNMKTDTYTASGTMYVYNGNPNLVNYQYTSTNDLNSAVQLLDTYMVVVKSAKVMDAVADRLITKYPGITPEFISKTLSMGSVSGTGVLRVNCRTAEAQLSADICNAVLDAAPQEIIRVVSAGGIEIIDYAVTPSMPDSRSPVRKGIIGALAGAVLAGAVLLFIFLMNHRIAGTKDLTDNFTPPVLASIRRVKADSGDPGTFLLSDRTPMETMDRYAKLRMNLLYTMAGKEQRVLVITSAIAGEGKSTVAANLAISCALGGKRVLLVDSDMRRACQRDIFKYQKNLPGLSEALIGEADWRGCLLRTDWENLALLPAGKFPPNPAELLSIDRMGELLNEMQKDFDLVLLDMPPINIVSDPLSVSSRVAGCLFVTRQDYSDLRDIRKALISAEMTGMEVLGFVFCGEKLHDDSYYKRKNTSKYYHSYDDRSRGADRQAGFWSLASSGEKTALRHRPNGPAGNDQKSAEDPGERADIVPQPDQDPGGKAGGGRESGDEYDDWYDVPRKPVPDFSGRDEDDQKKSGRKKKNKKKKE